LWSSHTGEHPEGDKATFGYRPAMKVEIYWSPKRAARGNITWGALIGQNKQPFCVIICLNWAYYESLLFGV
jgi:hypothetical protein